MTIYRVTISSQYLEEITFYCKDKIGALNGIGAALINQQYFQDCYELLTMGWREYEPEATYRTGSKEYQYTITPITVY